MAAELSDAEPAAQHSYGSLANTGSGSDEEERHSFTHSGSDAAPAPALDDREPSLAQSLMSFAGSGFFYVVLTSFACTVLLVAFSSKVNHAVDPAVIYQSNANYGYPVMGSVPAITAPSSTSSTAAVATVSPAVAAITTTSATATATTTTTTIAKAATPATSTSTAATVVTAAAPALAATTPAAAAAVVATTASAAAEAAAPAATAATTTTTTTVAATSSPKTASSTVTALSKKTASSIASLDGVSFSLSRVGYPDLPYFQAGASAITTYKFLAGYEAVIEPHADMGLTVVGASADMGKFEYALCASDGTCYSGSYDASSGKTVAANVPCAAMDKYTLTVTGYDTDGAPCHHSQ